MAKEKRMLYGKGGTVIPDEKNLERKCNWAQEKKKKQNNFRRREKGGAIAPRGREGRRVLTHLPEKRKERKLRQERGGKLRRFSALRRKGKAAKKKKEKRSRPTRRGDLLGSIKRRKERYT